MSQRFERNRATHVLTHLRHLCPDCSVHVFFLMPIASGLSPAEDPRKIDSTWHIPPGGENTSWNFLSSPGLWLPLGRKWARRFEWENNADECAPACRGGVGRVPGNGHPYPISVAIGVSSDSPMRCRQSNVWYWFVKSGQCLVLTTAIDR